MQGTIQNTKQATKKVNNNKKPSSNSCIKNTSNSRQNSTNKGKINDKVKQNKQVIEIETLRKGPVTWYNLTNQFSHINGWYWKTMVAIAPKDNKEDSLFHSVALATFLPYSTGVMKGERINKEKIVSDMRLEMHERLSYDIGIGGSKVFDILNGGHRLPVSYDELCAQFLGTASPTIYMLEHIGNCIEHDIYIYDHDLKDLWLLGNETYRLKNRNSIVLYHNKGVYDVIGICKPDNSIYMHFSPENEFIIFLKMRLEQIAT